ncbi:MAG: hypothetical protein OXG11_05665 [Chloroflexi bacterium]|nr:hypothetical protein [Chloroflexota bacterium]
MRSHRAFRRGWRRIAALAAAFCVAAGFLACGDDAPQAKIILTAVRVEERISDGAWSPVADVHVDYQIWAGRATSSADVVLFYEYQDFTDESGLSVVAQAADDKKPADIGLLFAEVTHDDGRTGFQRKQVEGEFDLLEWFETFWPEPVDADSVIDAICETAIGLSDCERYLGDQELVVWGRAILVRIR